MKYVGNEVERISCLFGCIEVHYVATPTIVNCLHCS